MLHAETDHMAIPIAITLNGKQEPLNVAPLDHETSDTSAAFRSEHNPVPVCEPGARCPIAAK
ncbi:hypothetical protein ASG39_00700 [Rhizobium sp. Leaf371]|nr:hypothetical protein ASG39_00700 [Rhizobium sp. Leaf371]